MGGAAGAGVVAVLRSRLGGVHCVPVVGEGGAGGGSGGGDGGGGGGDPAGGPRSDEVASPPCCERGGAPASAPAWTAPRRQVTMAVAAVATATATVAVAMATAVVAVATAPTRAGVVATVTRAGVGGSIRPPPPARRRHSALSDCRSPPPERREQRGVFSPCGLVRGGAPHYRTRRWVAPPPRRWALEAWRIKSTRARPSRTAPPPAPHRRHPTRARLPLYMCVRGDFRLLFDIWPGEWPTPCWH